jgi:C-terminal processing protease CtpA/Prc
MPLVASSKRLSYSSHNGGFCSVTVRKSKSNDKLGIELEEDVEAERVSVSKICNDSIFAKSELEVGDMVLSINGCTIRGHTLEFLLEKGNRAKEKVTISICKGDVAEEHLHRLEHDRHEVENAKKQKEKMSADEVSAEKNQNDKADAGIRFEVKDSKLIICEIKKQSIFRKQDLQVGDVVIKANGMDFIKYPDANYALKMVNKDCVKTVTLVLERLAIHNDDSGSEGEFGGE